MTATDLKKKYAHGLLSYQFGLWALAVLFEEFEKAPDTPTAIRLLDTSDALLQELATLSHVPDDVCEDIAYIIDNLIKLGGLETMQDINPYQYLLVNKKN